MGVSGYHEYTDDVCVLLAVHLCKWRFNLALVCTEHLSGEYARRALLVLLQVAHVGMFILSVSFNVSAADFCLHFEHLCSHCLRSPLLFLLLLHLFKYSRTPFVFDVAPCSISICI